MAIRQLVQQPEEFGVELVDIPNEPYFTQVSLNAGAMVVHSAAQLAGLSVEEFLSLNPAFPRKLIKAGGDVSVLVPVKHAELFQYNLDKGEWDSWEPVTAKKGMTVAEIAARFDTTPERLAEHNKLHLRNGKLIGDQVILAPLGSAEGSELPAATWQEAEAAVRETAASPAKYHVVRKGETLSQLAEKNHVSIADLKRYNRLKSTKLRVGQRLVLKPASPGTQAASGKGKSKSATTRYTVKRGDTLSSIADRFNVSISEIKSWNKLRSNQVQAGKQLTIKRS
jgi:membrane-bound lytic murein transglycosylase D